MFQIVFVYCRDASIHGKEMGEFCDYVFSNPKNAAGESDVKSRGNKTMTGMMKAYGSWDAYGPESQGLGKGVKQVRVYRPIGCVDSNRNDLLRSHVDTLTASERLIAPACADMRKTIADKVDPLRQHRMTSSSFAFSTTVSINYVTDPHDDRGAIGVLEFIQFLNSNGPLPSDHKLLFVLPGFICELPTRLDESVIIALPASGVFHGTLPTSSSQDTWLHGNYGSALITKAPVVKGLLRQQQRGYMTPARFQSSRLYFSPADCTQQPPRKQIAKGIVQRKLQQNPKNSKETTAPNAIAAVKERRKALVCANKRMLNMVCLDNAPFRQVKHPAPKRENLWYDLTRRVGKATNLTYFLTEAGLVQWEDCGIWFTFDLNTISARFTTAPEFFTYVSQNVCCVRSTKFKAIHCGFG